MTVTKEYYVERLMGRIAFKAAFCCLNPAPGHQLAKPGNYEREVGGEGGTSSLAYWGNTFEPWKGYCLTRNTGLTAQLFIKRTWFGIRSNVKVQD
jgi:hypothetical protein